MRLWAVRPPAWKVIHCSTDVAGELAGHRPAGVADRARDPVRPRPHQPPLPPPGRLALLLDDLIEHQRPGPVHMPAAMVAHRVAAGEHDMDDALPFGAAGEEVLGRRGGRLEEEQEAEDGGEDHREALGRPARLGHRAVRRGCCLGHGERAAVGALSVARRGTGNAREKGAECDHARQLLQGY
jgi:hypothetical protein